ncbi:bifunctional 23S rRNA (guanine(2069)-N(7))-methyltransferase RlmK/23S rRNA (guanine(2445)-N(2))-methyltransferase RlmL [Algiphilus sp.]|uniref:bifunctional 23S rRNA (guanine(2069)-N(7))-methyltransferase RlmK/23S rRNA (guanine(2445)-N(2))-methyltransferase RlmL n=1 Tax=Algiphilus sp. TaxID=1872431 RepID=UPI0025C46F24|nr:bifunctional 23S rRNA (guanine(2069)-N(7))-methyltransferase RlmK/23S rRNA (guanine(2445)-N(2))-methyltransferase RlmL [Algiphilus sp.]MCK5770975.1 bifunctional 23S rRNA (guanine(2069)-N(7))-methyltransferase RlmK/23S rRNA (guanine(2445)-N(2))-methyltransferase RlmL [Algiphilus sp.]
MQRFLATTSLGLAPVLRDELAALGATDAAELGGGVQFSADLDGLYTCLLGSRVASRIVLPLAEFETPTGDACYEAARAIDWPALFARELRFMVEVTGRSQSVSHTGFAGLRVKDGVVDRFREQTGERPDVDPDHPDVRVLLQLQGRRARLGIDLGNGGLHRRGYRREGGLAPLRENLAAGLLLRAGWPERADAGEAFCDPFCGSGTLVIEAALVATRTAPGLLRDVASPRGWNGHDAARWDAAVARARDAVRAWEGPPLRGFDQDPAAVATARSNARLAGMAAITRFERGDAVAVPAPAARGLMVANPPYGERLGDANELIKLYSLLGSHLRRAFGGWRVGLLLSQDADSQRLGLRASARHSVSNGPLACNFLQFDMREGGEEAAPSAPDFANRLAKNQRHLTRWARRNGVSCYRVYDADLPEYPLLIDRYDADGGEPHLHVQEMAAPRTVEPARAEARLRGALDALVTTTGVAAGRVHFKQRRAQKRGHQYTANEGTRDTAFHVDEHGCRLRVDLDHYLDTGLFLDHRPMRLRLQRECRDLRLLNLFCYTAAASVHAAVGGARQTVSVDLSNRYLDWAAENFAANGVRAERGDGRSRRLPGAHALLRADCMSWLATAREDSRLRFERIFCDPPTFSNSKRVEDDFDVQRDHAALITAAAALLAPGGVLYFSCNRRRFKLDEDALAGLRIRDITAATLDEDFRRPPPAHRCWEISREAEA